MADPRGFEPLFFSVTGRRVRPGYTMGPKVPAVGVEELPKATRGVAIATDLNYLPQLCQRWGSNPRPLAYETNALPLSYSGKI